MSSRPDELIQRAERAEADRDSWKERAATAEADRHIVYVNLDRIRAEVDSYDDPDTRIGAIKAILDGEDA